MRSRAAALVVLAMLVTLASCSRKASITGPLTSQGLSGQWTVALPYAPQFNPGSYSINGQDTVRIIAVLRDLKTLAPMPGFVAGLNAYTVLASVRLASLDSAYIQCGLLEGAPGNSGWVLVRKGAKLDTLVFTAGGGRRFAVQAMLRPTNTDPVVHSQVQALALSAGYADTSQTPVEFPAMKLNLVQSGTALTGSMQVGGSVPLPLTEGQVNGNTVTFKVNLEGDAWAFTGTVTNGVLQGTADAYRYAGFWSERFAWSARR